VRFQQQYPRFIAVYKQYAFRNPIAALKPLCAELDAYYAVNEQRNRIFMRHIISMLPRPGRKLRRTSTILITVTGGFHSQGLSRLLAQQKISNITITPVISGDAEGRDSVYESYIRQQASWYSMQ
jgi:hypothetical protein